MRHALRRLGRSPMFTGVALLTLAIGIGANTAVFSVIENVLLKPLPYPRPDQLIVVSHTAPGIAIKDLNISPSNYVTYREQGRAFQDIGIWTSFDVTVTGLGEPERVPSLQVTDGTLPVLGVQPALGRAFLRYDDSPASPETAILSWGYWQRRFAGDRSAIGKRIEIEGRPREIIGVLPATFRFHNLQPSLVLPIRLNRAKISLGSFNYQAVARLRPGVSLSQAGADVARMLPIVHASFPAPGGISVKMFEDARIAPNLRPLKQDVIGDVGNVLWVTMATVGLVLLIACANVANLLLVRAESRQHELAIRTALGAGWSRLARELLGESLSLGLAGGALGVALAWAGLRGLVALAPVGLPRLDEIAIDPWALAFALTISLFAGALFGIIPIFKYAGPRTANELRQGRGLSASRESHRARGALVVTQVALALVLLICSGLMIRTFQALHRVQPGFTRPEQVQTLRLSIPGAQVPDAEQVLRMQQEIQRKLAAIAGVTSVSFSSSVTMDGNNSFDPVFPEDRPYAQGKLPPVRRFKFAAPNFLATVGNPLVAGRDFTWSEIQNRVPVAIVTESLAREYWRDPSAAIGKRIRENLAGQWREIIGVAGDERDNGVDHKPPTTVYWPILMKDFWGNPTSYQRNVAFAIRSHRAGTESFLQEIRQAVWSVNPSLPLASVRTLDEIYRRSMARTSFTLVMLAIAGGMALLLGIVGIYGVISYSVSQRTREIGIRLALGAQNRDVTRLFLSDAFVLTSIGLAIGLVGAAGVTRLLASLLFEISPADPMTYSAVALVLTTAAALASYVPSRRALRVDPVEALRAE